MILFAAKKEKSWDSIEDRETDFEDKAEEFADGALDSYFDNPEGLF